MGYSSQVGNAIQMGNTSQLGNASQLDNTSQKGNALQMGNPYQKMSDFTRIFWEEFLHLNTTLLEKFTGFFLKYSPLAPMSKNKIV
jgi:hypothetical protein